MNPTSAELRRMKNAFRELRMEREKLVGKPRASQWGGKGGARQSRRQTKADLRNVH